MAFALPSRMMKGGAKVVKAHKDGFGTLGLEHQPLASLSPDLRETSIVSGLDGHDPISSPFYGFKRPTCGHQSPRLRALCLDSAREGSHPSLRAYPTVGLAPWQQLACDWITFTGENNHQINRGANFKRDYFLNITGQQPSPTVAEEARMMFTVGLSCSNQQ